MRARVLAEAGWATARHGNFNRAFEMLNQSVEAQRAGARFAAAAFMYLLTLAGVKRDDTLQFRLEMVSEGLALAEAAGDRVAETGIRTAYASTLSYTDVDNLELAERTAIGEAIFSCLDAIKTFQAQLQGTDPSEGNAPARVVLMSDGSNTWGRSPEQAVGAAKQAAIPVSTIAFGTDTGYIDLEGQRVVVPVDHEKLKEIADGTGGSYYAAASAEELSNVYRDLGSQIGYTTERREITTWFVGHRPAVRVRGGRGFVALVQSPVVSAREPSEATRRPSGGTVSAQREPSEAGPPGGRAGSTVSAQREPSEARPPGGRAGSTVSAQREPSEAAGRPAAARGAQ